MRSALLILATVAVLFGLFVAYTRLATPARTISAEGPEIPTTFPSGQSSAFVAGAWVNLYDRDGQVYGRLRAASLVPRPDNRAQLTAPEAEFYEHDGRIIHLTAHDGDVRLAGDSSHSPLAGAPTPLPSQGTLEDVTIRLYAGPAARDRDQPDMTLHMDNTQFDADTFRLFTVAEFDAASGADRPADRIPISVRGRDMDFDGWGMMLVWDGQVHELKSLLIAHGKQLRIKSAVAMESMNSTDSSAAGRKENPTSRPAAEMSGPQPVYVYRATFSQNVRVIPRQQQGGQGGQETAQIQADQMIVTFAARGEGGGGDSRSGPGHGPATAAANPSPVAQAADVLWDGSLRIVPVNDRSISLLPGQATVAFLRSADQPLRLALERDGKPAGEVLAERADYSQGGPVLFTGQGSGDFTDPDRPADLLHVAWAKTCELTMAGAGGKLHVQRASLLGEAELKQGPIHGPERIRLGAQRITVDFDPAGTPSRQARVSRLVAAGMAHGLIHDGTQADRRFAADTLTVDTASDARGNLYPKAFTAEGHFHGSQDQDDLTSDRMVAYMVSEPKATNKSSAEGAFALQSMTAIGHVQAKGRDGSSATGEQLRVEQVDPGHQVATLLGTPWAIVSGTHGTLRGREIEIDPRRQTAGVVGPGWIDAIAAASERATPAAVEKPDDHPRPIHVQWETAARIDAAANQINVQGNVYADTTDSGGATSSAHGEQIVLDLVPGPSTRPARSGQPGVADMDLLSGKQVKTVSLRRRAWIDTTQPSADGGIARRTHIEGADIEADLPAKRLVVPGAGRILLEDHGKGRGAADSTGHGQWGMQWADKFTFDELAGSAIIEGRTRTVHWSDEPRGGATEILADWVVADFDRAKPEGGKPADANQELNLRQLEARDHVQITTFADRTMTEAKKTVEAKIVLYDPVAEVLTVTGGPNGKVRVTDAANAEEQSFDQVEINLRDGGFKVSNFAGQAK